jgi:RND family efflux transporter MFP subunit
MSAPQPRLEDLRIHREKIPAGPRRTGPIAAGVAAVAVLAAAAWWLARPKAPEVRTVAAREVAAAGPGAARTVLNASGYVTARREATVSSKITGKVVEVLIEEGVKVTAGQLLARLDDTNTRASLQLAHAQLDAAKSALEETRVRVGEAEREQTRQQQLVSRGVATTADYDRAESTTKALNARLAQLATEVTVAERNAALWQQQLDDTVIRAPFAGIVTSKNAQPGEMISPMSSGGFTRTGICTIVDMDSLEIEIDVNESYINRVAPGQPVEATLDAYADWKIPCKVIAIIPTADRQKSTVRVRVGFDQPDARILPEMSVKVAFRETSANTASTGGAGATARNVVVPAAALRQDGGRDVVFVVASGRLERRAVTVAGTRAGETELSAGVAAGERVVVEAPTGLADGASVTEKKL